MFKQLMKHQQFQWLVKVLKRLTDAPDSVADAHLRMRLQVMNALILFITLAVFFGLAVGWFYAGYTPSMIASLVGMLLIYLTSKAGYYTVAVWALIFLLAVVPKVIWLNDDPGSPRFTSEVLINWTILASIISYFVFNLRHVVPSLILSTLALVAAMVLNPVAQLHVSGGIFLAVSVNVLLIIAVYMRERSEKVITQQAETLEQERIRLNTLLEATQEALFIHKHGEILLVNPAFEKLFGYNSSDIIGKHIEVLIAKEDHANVVARYQENDDRPYEVTGLHRNGTPLTLELFGQSQYYRGERMRVVSMRDISQRKEEEQHNFDLTLEQEKVRILQKFISDISHDLRTPLSVINTSIYLIEKLANNPQRQQAQIEVLQGQATQVQRLLEDLITMSRLDKADTSDFAYRYLDIHDLLKQIVHDSQNDALRKSQQLVFRPTDQSTPQVFVDPAQVKRMMRYLILNGVSYTPEGGSIVISTFCEPGVVVISVRDSGPGIPEHKLPYIFDQFYRGDEARGGNGGAGLGLTIARKIAQAHSGSISVKSKVGEGSDFRISLPVPATTTI